MAEVLVYCQVTKRHPDPAKSAMAPKCGQVIAVKPDGSNWGRKEVPPDFVVLRVRGVAVQDAAVARMMDPVKDGDDIIARRGFVISKGAVLDLLKRRQRLVEVRRRFLLDNAIPVRGASRSDIDADIELDLDPQIQAETRKIAGEVGAGALTWW